MVSEIIKGCRKQRRKSQKKLYKMFYAYGMSITLRYADTRNHAAEILNDAFLKVFTNINSYDTEKPFKPWLRQIIVNTAINHFHKHKTSWKREDLELVQSELARKETITNGISYQEIIDLVQQLTPSYRLVFNLYVIEGYTHDEIAEKLGIAVGTSKSNLFKAKRNLQTLLEKNLI